MIDIEKCEDIININDITDIDDIKNQCEYWKHKRGKQKEKTYKDSVNLLNEEDVTNINNITNKKDIINIIDQVTSKDGEGGSIETTTELNQCSYIEDKKAKALCEERINDHSHGVDPIDIQTIDDVKNLNDETDPDVIRNCFEYWKYKEGKQKHKTHKDSVDLLNIEDITDINTITNVEDIKNIIERLISQVTEPNQCSFIEDKEAKADCESRMYDDDHGDDGPEDGR